MQSLPWAPTDGSHGPCKALPPFHTAGLSGGLSGQTLEPPASILTRRPGASCARLHVRVEPPPLPVPSTISPHQHTFPQPSGPCRSHSWKCTSKSNQSGRTRSVSIAHSREKWKASAGGKGTTQATLKAHRGPTTGNHWREPSRWQRVGGGGSLVFRALGTEARALVSLSVVYPATVAQCFGPLWLRW